MERRTWALLLAYDGAPFKGWQSQAGMATVQEAVERALAAALGRELQIFGAGRTDAGVHAEGQVAHFHVRLPIEREPLLAGMRAALPASIELRDLRPASDSFHARSSSIGKRYRYRFTWGETREPRAFWLGERAEPRWERARDALERLRDVPLLRGLGSPSRDHKPAPPLDGFTLTEIGTAAADLELHARAFRKHQVRNMAGHLAATALGLAEPPSLAELAKLNRPWRGATAPPHGLTLLRVNYPDELDPFRELSAAGQNASRSDERASTSATTSR